MMLIEGSITTTHQNPACIAGALRVDNLSALQTESAGAAVRTTITGAKIRSVIASVDDYLMNLAIADEICRYTEKNTGTTDSGTGPSTRQDTGNRQR